MVRQHRYLWINPCGSTRRHRVPGRGRQLRHPVPAPVAKTLCSGVHEYPELGTHGRQNGSVIHLLGADGWQVVRHERIGAIAVVALEGVGIAIRTQVNRLASHYRQLGSARSLNHCLHHRLQVVAPTSIATRCRRAVPGAATDATREMDDLIVAAATQVV